MAYIKNQAYWTNKPCHRFVKETKKTHVDKMREGVQRFCLWPEAEEFKFSIDSEDSPEEDQPEGTMAPETIAVLGKEGDKDLIKRKISHELDATDNPDETASLQ